MTDDQGSNSGVTRGLEWEGTRGEGGEGRHVPPNANRLKVSKAPMRAPDASEWGTGVIWGRG